MGIGGQSSGDFKLTQGALRILYSLIKDSIPSLSADAFTQSNPNVIASTASAKSTTLPANVKKGVLGGSVAFTRPDIGANTIGGAVLVSAAFVAKTRPLGLFINDALGNSFENTPAVASGKGPFLRGGAAGVKIYETQVQTVVAQYGVAGVIGTAITYSIGDFLYASVNGLLTNRWADSYEAQWINAASPKQGSDTANSFGALEVDCTRMGTVLAPPDATNAELFLELCI